MISTTIHLSEVFNRIGLAKWPRPIGLAVARCVQFRIFALVGVWIPLESDMKKRRRSP